MAEYKSYLAKNGTGIILKIGNSIIHVSSFSDNRNTQTQKFETIGRVLPVEIQSTGFEVTLSVNYTVINTDRSILTEYGSKTIDGQVDTSKSNVIKSAMRYDLADKATFETYFRHGQRNIDLCLYQLVSQKDVVDYAAGNIDPTWEREKLIYQYKDCIVTSESLSVQTGQLVTGTLSLITINPPLNIVGAKS